ncbi:hypothetical protein P3L10_032488 [Capsicum annuum]
MPDCNAIYLPEGISDHCPAKITLATDRKVQRKSFLYYNTWAYHPKFLEIVCNAPKYHPEMPHGAQGYT